MSPSRTAGRRAMTLTEMVVVMAIIASLVALIAPATSTIRESAKRVACAGNLRSLGAATLAYLGDEHDRLPGGDNWNQACSGQWYSTAHKAVETYLVSGTQVNSASAYKMMRCPANPKGVNYAFFAGQPWDKPATLQRVIACARKWNAPGGVPVLWADQTCLVGSNPIGDFNTACNHKGVRMSASTGLPAGGNVSLADGAVRWLPYRGNATVSEPAWVLNGGSIGGWRAIPNCMVWLRLDSSGNLDTSRWDNLVVGRWNLAYGSSF